MNKTYNIWKPKGITSFDVIRQLKKNNAFQNIYALAPQTHQKKGRTPSFGGCIFIIMMGNNN